MPLNNTKLISGILYGLFAVLLLLLLLPNILPHKGTACANQFSCNGWIACRWQDVLTFLRSLWGKVVICGFIYGIASAVFRKKATYKQVIWSLFVILIILIIFAVMRIIATC
jgi:hypothetical protein